MSNVLHRKYSPFYKVCFREFAHISQVFNAYWSIPMYLKRCLLFAAVACTGMTLSKILKRKKQTENTRITEKMSDSNL